MACIILDDGRKFWITRADLLASGWHEGSAANRRDFEHYVLLYQYPHALNQAVSMLARRPCSMGEIRHNLKRHHYDENVIDLVICKLEKEKLLNDQEFSEIWVQQRCKKYGSFRIRQELKAKGISEATAEDALSHVSDAEMLENATTLAAKEWSKIKPGEDIRKSRHKVITSLVRKGYEWDMAKQASDTVEKQK